MTYVCPNGHAFPEFVAVECKCEECDAQVACVPSAVVIDLHTTIVDMRKAGDNLARRLSNAPGIDVMRSSDLGEWQRVAHIAPEINLEGE